MVIYKSAQYYDLVNSAKNYKSEVQIVHRLLLERGVADRSTLLDTACGTGEHLRFLQEFYNCEGLDVDPEFVVIAQEKLGVAVHLDDMRSFTLAKQYDIVTCLFSSIAYAKTEPSLQSTIENMAKHIVAGGFLVIEPWYTPDTFRPGHISVLVKESPEIKISRMQIWNLEAGFSASDSHILVGERTGITHIRERHELGLFTREQYSKAFKEAGLVVEFVADGLTDRGLFLGRKPAQ